MKKISDVDLLNGVNEFENELQKDKRFTDVKFLEWEELSDVDLKHILKVKISKDNREKIMLIPRKHLDAMYNISTPLDGKNLPRDEEDLRNNRELLFKEVIDQLNDTKWKTIVIFDSLKNK